MFGFGIIEIVIVLIIVIVLFGASRLPEIGRGVGEALKNFKKSISETSESDDVQKKKTDQEK
jgi:sec-independent protein translocase protein TatA